MLSIHIRLTNRAMYTQPQGEVIYKDEHINTTDIQTWNLHTVNVNREYV